MAALRELLKGPTKKRKDRRLYYEYKLWCRDKRAVGRRWLSQGRFDR